MRTPRRSTDMGRTGSRPARAEKVGDVWTGTAVTVSRITGSRAAPLTDRLQLSPGVATLCAPKGSNARVEAAGRRWASEISSRRQTRDRRAGRCVRSARSRPQLRCESPRVAGRSLELSTVSDGDVLADVRADRSARVLPRGS